MAWVVLWSALVVGSAGFLTAVGLRVFRKGQALRSEVGRAARRTREASPTSVANVPGHRH